MNNTDELKLDNIYLEALKIGSKHLNKDGISYNQMVDALNDDRVKKVKPIEEFIGNGFTKYFRYWFYKNFYNYDVQSTDDDNRAVLNSFLHVDVHTRIQHPSPEYHFSLDETRSFLKSEALSKLLDYEELQQARKAASEARSASEIAQKYATKALTWTKIIGIASIVIALISISIDLFGEEKSILQADSVYEFFPILLNP